MASIKIVSLLLLCIMVAAPFLTANATITCSQVISSVAPCVGYLQTGRGPTPGCCGGIRGLSGAARSTADRQQACNCLKAASGSIRGINPSYAGSLPGKCGVSVPYKISPTTNCANVK